MNGDMSGVLYGGWGYVAAVYGLTWTGLIAYFVSLIVRGRRVS